MKTKKQDFDKLPRAEQRVVIAKDLIKRLDARTFIALKGTYWRAEVANPHDRERQLRDVLKGKVCKGCQIGGMFACALDRHNALKLGDLVYSTPDRMGDTEMRKYLTRWFSEKDINAMERAFEAWEPDNEESRQMDFKPLSIVFPLPEDRMRLIAKNIIKNKGRFVPAQLLELAAQV